MEIYKIVMLLMSLIFVVSAVIKIRKIGFEQYALTRGLGLWFWFCIKFIFVIITLLTCIDWSFLNYKIEL